MRKTKPTVRWDADAGLLHIEAPGAIINIRVGLRTNGNSADVTAVEVLADGDRYAGAGERPWWIEGEVGNNHHSVRILRRD